MTKRGWLLFAAMGLIWGVPYLFIKIAVEDLTPATLVLLRTGVGALLLLPIAAVRGELKPLLRHWKALLAFAVAEIAIPWLLLTRAETRLSSSLTGLLVASVPLVGALLGRISGTDRLDARRLLGLAFGVAGVAALAGLDLHGGDVGALLEMVVVAIGYAVGPFVLAHYLNDAPRLGTIAAALGVTAVVYLPFGIAQAPAHWPSFKVDASVVVLAVICTAIAFLLFFALIDEVGPVRSTVITYLNPAVAVALGVAFLHESFTWGIALGFALILGGSLLATRRATTPPPSAEPQPGLAAPSSAEPQPGLTSPSSAAEPQSGLAAPSSA